jgi:predicted exporter
MRGRAINIGVWIVLSVLAVIVVARAQYTADLSAFLPNAPSPAQRMLVEQLREGPASRLILLAIEGADASVRANLSRALAARLRSDPGFRAIANGEASGSDQDREFIFRHRYLLSSRVAPDRFTVAGLHAALQESVDLLSSPLGLVAKDLFTRDPTGETLQVLSELDRTIRPSSVDGVWVSQNNGRALLVAETRADGSDIDAQQRAIDAIKLAFNELQRAAANGKSSSPILRMTGPGVFAVAARSTIEHEAIRLSVVSSVLIAIFLLVVYRSLPALLLGLLPVVTGALAGVAAVALGFGVVHGVTLGFGVTLIGESVDYSVYLFIQAQRGADGNRDSAGWIAASWPTIRLGMLTSVCGFASLLPSGFPGLAQLGLYSIAGLVAAAMVTRFVLPALLPRNFAVGSAATLGRAFTRALTPLRNLRHLLWLVPVVAGLIVYLNRDRLWNRELAALSPVSAAEQQLDGVLRANLGTPDVRTIIVLSGADSAAVLQAAEALNPTLESLVTDGVIAGFESPARYLPSTATQQFRRSSLPPANELRARLALAVASLPVRAERLEPFVQDVEVARNGPLLERAEFDRTSMASGVEALLVRHGERWNALLPLQAISTGPQAYSIDVDRVTREVGKSPAPGVEAVVLDLKRESDTLYSSYLAEAVKLSLAGLGAILMLLLITLRSAARVARVVAPLILAVLVVMSGFALISHPLTILHLVGMLLIIAVGSNYALFFDRESTDSDPDAAARTLASLLIANVSTVIGFGVLALSTVPVLAALGSTVAPGALLALVFAAILAKSSTIPAQAASSC